ncbi:MAG: NAD-dependent epimerase/dehydratase family protein [Acidobacteria bacterium]|nr:NAD-dependent epimerase/dehydratase family protein [Acidobacteriota bacterium]
MSLVNALITGGAGFIGSHVAERCLQEGWAVSVLDDLSTGSLTNIAVMARGPRFSYTVGSILDERLVGPMVERSDIVFHLAAKVGVRLVLERPIHTLHTNVEGTRRVLEAAAGSRKRIVIASSSEVYGKSDRIPYCEDADLVLGKTSTARWGYGCSKALDEFLALAYHQELGLPVTVVRLFNTAGPRQKGDYGMVLPAFVRQALLGSPITVFGDGTQSRCFTHVEDVAESLVRLVKTPKASGQVVNVGNDDEIRIADLAEMVRDRVGSFSEIVRIPYEKAYAEGFEEMVRRVPSLVKLERLISFRPRTPLERIIDTLAEDMRGRMVHAQHAAACG